MAELPAPAPPHKSSSVSSSPVSSNSSPPSLNKISTMDLLNELRRRYNCLSLPERRFILIGPPGSGKGTQSNILESGYCLCHISTGDILRDAVKNASLNGSLGMKTKALMDKGELVPDDIIMPLLEEKINSPECKRGFILDGFPRSAAQVNKLNTILFANNVQLDGVINFNIRSDELVERVCGRRVHLPSGRLYHTKFYPPLVAGVDDVTGEPLTRRPDDNEQTLVERLKSFRQDTLPIVEHYSQLGMLYTVDANKSSKEVTQQVMDIFKNNASAVTTSSNSSSNSGGLDRGSITSSSSKNAFVSSSSTDRS